MLVSVVGEAPVEEDLVEDVEPVGSEAERGLISTKSDSTCTEVHSNVLYTVSIFCTEIQTKENGNRDGLTCVPSSGLAFARHLVYHKRLEGPPALG